MNGAGRLLDRLGMHPRVVLCAAAGLALLAAGVLFDPLRGVPRYRMDASMAALLPAAGAARATYERSRRTFGDDDLLFVAWSGGDLFTPARLAAFKALTRALEQVPGVRRVDSLASAVDAWISGTETVIDPLLRRVPADAAAAAELRARATAHPLLRGQLVSPDGRDLLIAVHFAPDLPEPALAAAVARIRAASAATADGVETFLSGPLLVRLELSSILARDVHRVTPLAIVATLAIGALAFRNLRGTLLPCAANLLTVLVTLAVFVARGHALDFVTIGLPSVVYVVGYAYAIHVVSEFERCSAPGRARTATLAEALAAVRAPLTLNAATTAISFAALAASGVTSITAFGLYAALGAAVAWAVALTVVPAGLLLLPARAGRPASTATADAMAARLARGALSHRAILLSAAALLALGSAWQASRLVIDTDVLANFRGGSAIEQQFQRVAGTFGGAVPMRVLVEAAPEALTEPANLRALASLAGWLRAQPEIGGVYSLVDYLALMQRALAPDAGLIDGLPASPRLVRHLFLNAGPDLARFVDPAFGATVMHLRATTLSTAAVDALATRIEARLRTLPPALRGSVTGLTVLSARTVDGLSESQLRSLVAALATVFVVLAAVFRSIPAGALALIPNALPILVYFGLLGALALPLNLTTSLVACAVFGIAVDDTVMLCARYRTAALRLGAGEAALADALAGVLRPVSITTAALCAGFLALTSAELASQAQFGLLAAATLAVAWIIDLAVTPALLLPRRH